MRYNPLGRLHETVTNVDDGIPANDITVRRLYDGGALVAEYDQTGAMLRRYVHGPNTGADTPLVWYEGPTMSQAAARMLNTDLQGSVTSVTDFSGAPIAINRYDEYGRPQSGNVGRFQYTGQAWLPEIGLYYYKARMYSPTLGRFMQTDPIGYADGVNWYNYVGGDPVNFVDPTGLAFDRVVNGIVYRFGCVSVGDGPITCSEQVVGYALERRAGTGENGPGRGATPRGGGRRGPEAPHCKRAREASEAARKSLPKEITTSGNWNSASRLRYDWGSAYQISQELEIADWYLVGLSGVTGFGTVNASINIGRLTTIQIKYVGAGTGLISSVAAKYTIDGQKAIAQNTMNGIESRLNYLQLIKEGECNGN